MKCRDIRVFYSGRMSKYEIRDLLVALLRTFRETRTLRRVKVRFFALIPHSRRDVTGDFNAGTDNGDVNSSSFVRPCNARFREEICMFRICMLITRSAT